MTTETRLDVATLRAMEAYHFGEAADWDGECRAQAQWHHDECQRLRALADAAESAPPRLSDWVRACEGTALGGPGICRESLDFSLGLFFDVDGFGRTEGADPEEWAAIEVHLDAERPGGWMARVYVARDEGAMHARCTTPSDLRAALEALAKAGA